MITNDLMSLVRANFAHTPTHEQVTVMDMWCRFLLARDMESIFLLRGYAGTGKTSLVGALVRTLEQLGQRFCLLAPTGRAAKVMASYSGFRASTIHRRIYRQKVFGQDIFDPVPNLHPDTLYIVDEASMISNDGLSGSIFGDGRLLDDLIQYVYGTEGCRLMLIGDNAQLPPVGESESPALSISNLSGYGLSVMHAELTEVVRQASDSGILWNATCLRTNLCQGAVILPKMQLGYPDIKKVPGTLSECVYNLGVAILTTRSIFIGVLQIYGKTNSKMVLIYTILAVVFLVAGVALYLYGLFTQRKKQNNTDCFM